jgi:hypothetical protein
VDSPFAHHPVKIIVTNQDNKPILIGFQEIPRPIGKSRKLDKLGTSAVLHADVPPTGVCGKLLGKFI